MLNTAEARQQYRQLMIPEGAQRDARSTDYAEVYTDFDSARGYYRAKGFIGTSAKPAFFYRFKTEAQREVYIVEFFRNQQARRDMMQARKAKRVSYSHTLAVGDIAHTSWGYDQTNVSFYEVTRIVSDKSVAVRPIKCTQRETGFMSGNVTPQAGEFCGPETVHRVREGNVIVNVEHGRYSAYPNGKDTSVSNSWYA